MKQSDKAYDKFKEAMFSGKVALGETITQATLATLLGVRISPLRVAVNKLETEGFIKILSRSGIQVIKPNLDLIRNCYQLRILIERGAVKEFTRSAADSEILDLMAGQTAVLKRCRSSESVDSIKPDAAKLDSRIHFRFVEALENPIISNIFALNEERIKLIRIARPIMHTNMMIEESTLEHLQFLDAIKSRDQAQAAAILGEHLSASMKRAMGL